MAAADPSQRIRAFIALAVTDELRVRVAEVQAAFSRVVSDVRWMDPSACHLTLRFLGNIAPADVETIATRCAAVAGERAGFQLEFAGLGVFPRMRAARVLWIGTSSGTEVLVGLQAEIERALAGLGLGADEGPFSPHLTIGRFRQPPHRSLLERLQALAASYEGVRLGLVPVDRLLLMRSELSSTGARHSLLASIPLGGA